MNLPEFLHETELGSIRITGHRIGLMHLVHYYNEGQCAEMLWYNYPSLSLAVIHKVIAFYLENKVEVDEYIARCQAEIDHQRATTPRGPSFAELRKRFEAMHQAEKP